MIKKFYPIILFSAVLCFSAAAQNKPDYKERIFGVTSDSSMQTQNLLPGSEGSVDPTEYILGAGDKLFVNISGIEEIPLYVVVNQEDALYVPKVGEIDLHNFTLAEAKQKIKDEINKYYKDVNIFISLVDFRKMKVSLLGDVKKPASFIMPGNARLMDLINNSLGLTKTSDFRNIKIRDKNGDFYKIDLLSFLRYGDKKNNPLLKEGDVVIVDKIDKTVAVKGEVKYPGTYEFVDGETAAELIKLAGGFLTRAKKDTIEVVRFSDDGYSRYSEYFTYNEIMNKNIVLKNMDEIMIRSIPEYFEANNIEIKGYIKHPGTYKIIKDKTTLYQIINEAGGFRKEASLRNSKLIRSNETDEYDPEYERLKVMDRKDMTDDEYDYLKAKSRQHKGNIVTDFVELFRNHNMEEDVALKNGDVIEIPERKDYIVLLGQVVNPGKIIYNPDLSYEDYIDLAGGFGWRAENNDVRIVKAGTGEWVDADDVDSLKPGDTIWIPETSAGTKILGRIYNILTSCRTGCLHRCSHSSHYSSIEEIN